MHPVLSQTAQMNERTAKKEASPSESKSEMQHSLGDAVGRREHPLSADERSAAQVLVERVDERHLPAPLSREGVLASHDAGFSAGGALQAADVLAPRRGLRGSDDWRGCACGRGE